ncbi:MAG: acetate--CoA ligase [Acidobacteriaceae bacterium]
MPLDTQVVNANVFETHMHEVRMFPPPAEFSAQARLGSVEEYEQMYRRSVEDPEGFWGDAARELEWFAPWERVLDESGKHARWFTGGKLNLSHNCIDRHAKSARRDKVALVWEGEPYGEDGKAEVRRLTYGELHEQVQRFANVLKSLGVKKGDRVAVYMGMSLELAIAVLACARVGAVHSVVFGGFAAQAISDRVNDADCQVVLTQDLSYRRGAEVRLKEIVDTAMEKCPNVRSVVVYQREPKSATAMKPGRDVWWHEAMAAASADCPAEWMDAEDPLYILYTSGTTGKPKGLVHSTGGYAVQTYLSSKYVFDLKDEDVYWCTADIGWVTGHSYVLYGPLQMGATVLMYEGAPFWPEKDRFWKVVDDHKVSIFYTAPTAIRAFIKFGAEWVHKHDLSSLRLLGTVGEPINPEAWMWYHREIGKGRCPIVDTWWQTETGSIMIAPMPGVVATKPGSATRPFFGVVPEIVAETGEPVEAGQGGVLRIKRPWPSMARTIWGNPEMYEKAYFPGAPGVYVTGDGARCDEDGYYWLMGRVDDVINVSGHRLGTAEVESALVGHGGVAEAAVVGRPDEAKGQAIAAFVVLEEDHAPSEALRQELRKWVSKEIGPLARPDDLRFVERLPKTRSGKIMRRLLRELAATGEVKGDTTSLEDFTVLAQLRESDE